VDIKDSIKKGFDTSKPSRRDVVFCFLPTQQKGKEILTSVRSASRTTLSIVEGEWAVHGTLKTGNPKPLTFTP